MTVGGDLRRRLPYAGVDDQLVPALVDAGDRRAHLHVDAELTGRLHELSDEIGVEPLQRTLPAVKDRHRSADAYRDVRELEGDVPATDEDHPAVQVIKFQEAGTGREVLLASDAGILGRYCRADRLERPAYRGAPPRPASRVRTTA